MVRVAQRLGRENFNRYMRSFGFGATTGVDLPGETGGLLRPTQRWSALSLASLSFGQEIGVTALQLASAVSAVANGGTLMRPTIVRHVEDRTGAVVRTTHPAVVRRVIEPGTVDGLTALLEGVVENGTGRLAAVPGYRVAGKTGTAQKIDATGKYSMIDHVASFVGYVPASRPAIVILVSLDTPRGPRNQGGDVAAPLFARIAEPALRRLAIPADDPTRVLRASTPSAAAVIPASYSPATALPVDDGDASRMPDLRGRSAREAAITAARRGLVVELKGSGRVIAQHPEAGAGIEPGMSCRLELGRAPEEPR
jgi:cell division protein FtsI (penicillin-binding protein 3)